MFVYPLIINIENSISVRSEFQIDASSSSSVLIIGGAALGLIYFAPR